MRSEVRHAALVGAIAMVTCTAHAAPPATATPGWSLVARWGDPRLKYPVGSYIAALPDGTGFATVGADRILRVFRWSDGAVRKAFPIGERADGLLITRDGKRVLVDGADSNALDVYRLSDGKLLTRLDGAGTGHRDAAGGL